ncbi:hypothetical protein HN903_03335 [archaeon]|jgi:hypothetical protein|nr:hypothetical protein [archaeon]MBT7128763.1 hypothetical protein [archaeon]
MDYREEFYSARWHLDVAKRMLGVYDEYAEKRVLVGVIREGAKSAGKLVRAFLIREGAKGNLQTFMIDVAPRYLSEEEICGVVGILNLERDQKLARVEFVRNDKVLLEVGGKWKILEVSRLREIIGHIGSVVENFRQV